MNPAEIYHRPDLMSGGAHIVVLLRPSVGLTRLNAQPPLSEIIVRTRI